MPAPFTIATFTDDDGDEFCVRVFPGRDEPRSSVIDYARTLIADQVADGMITPNGNLRFESLSGTWDGITGTFVSGPYSVKSADEVAPSLTREERRERNAEGTATYAPRVETDARLLAILKAAGIQVADTPEPMNEASVYAARALAALAEDKATRARAMLRRAMSAIEEID